MRSNLLSLMYTSKPHGPLFFIFNYTLNPNGAAHIYIIWVYLHNLVIVPEVTLLTNTTCSYFNSCQLSIALQIKIVLHILVLYQLPLMLKGSLA